MNTSKNTSARPAPTTKRYPKKKQKRTHTIGDHVKNVETLETKASNKSLNKANSKKKVPQKIEDHVTPTTSTSSITLLSGKAKAYNDKLQEGAKRINDHVDQIMKDLAEGKKIVPDPTRYPKITPGAQKISDIINKVYAEREEGIQHLLRYKRNLQAYGLLPPGRVPPTKYSRHGFEWFPKFNKNEPDPPSSTRPPTPPPPDEKKSKEKTFSTVGTQTIESDNMLVVALKTRSSSLRASRSDGDLPRFMIMSTSKLYAQGAVTKQLKPKQR